MLEIRSRKTLQSKVNICKSEVKIGDYADSLSDSMIMSYVVNVEVITIKCKIYYRLRV